MPLVAEAQEKRNESCRTLECVAPDHSMLALLTRHPFSGGRRWRTPRGGAWPRFVVRTYRFQHRIRLWFASATVAARSGREASARIRNKAPDPPTNVVIVLTGLLGDSVMATPLLAEVRRLLPSARLTVLGYPHNRAVLSGCPFIDEWISVRADPLSHRHRAATAQLVEDLRRHHFDMALISLGAQFAPILARAQIPIRVGYADGPVRWCLTNVVLPPDDIQANPSLRPSALQTVGLVTGDDVPPQLWPEASALGSLREKLETAGASFPDGYVVLHASGSTVRQWWPAERMAGVAEALHERFGLSSVVVGVSPRGRLAVQPWLLDTTGALTVAELVALIDGATAVVTTDSGPLHIAGALGRPSVGLFRALRAEHATRYPGLVALVGDHPGCARHCTWDRCRGEEAALQTNVCRQMRSIQPAAVVEALASVTPSRGS